MPEATTTLSGEESPILRRFRRITSFPVVLGATLVVLAFATARLNLPDPDVWWHIAVGEEILATGQWPTQDSYSYTAPGHEWMAYEWLGEVGVALAAGWAGFTSLTIFLIILCSVLLLLVYRYAYLVTGHSKAAFLATALVWPLSAVVFTLRPQLLGYVFLALTLVCLESFRRGQKKALWVLPLLFLVWVNTHGTFIFGLFLLGWFWLSGLAGFERGGLKAKPQTPRDRRLLLIGFVACVVMLPLTPYGARVAAYPFQMALLQPTNFANIQEWQPVPFDLGLGKYFLLLLLAFLGLQFIRPVTFRLYETGLFFLTLYMACVHRRFLVFFAIAFAPLLATQLSAWMPRYQNAKDKYALNVVMLVVAVIGMVGYFPAPEKLEAAVAKRFPRDAVAYLRENPVAGPMLNEYAYGGYLIWARRPNPEVFVDGRVDFYEYTGIFGDYLSITRVEPKTLLLLDKYNVQSCLVGREAPLATFLSALPDWEQVYADELSVVFLRKQVTDEPSPSS
jgi:hypothetical protein